MFFEDIDDVVYLFNLSGFKEVIYLFSVIN